MFENRAIALASRRDSGKTSKEGYRAVEQVVKALGRDVGFHGLVEIGRGKYEHVAELSVVPVRSLSKTFLYSTTYAWAVP